MDYVQIVPEDTCLTSMTKPFKLDSLQPLCLKVRRDNLLGGWMIIYLLFVGMDFQEKSIRFQISAGDISSIIVPFGFNVG